MWVHIHAHYKKRKRCSKKTHAWVGNAHRHTLQTGSETEGGFGGAFFWPQYLHGAHTALSAPPESRSTAPLQSSRLLEKGHARKNHRKCGKQQKVEPPGLNDTTHAKGSAMGTNKKGGFGNQRCAETGNKGRFRSQKWAGPRYRNRPTPTEDGAIHPQEEHPPK